MRLPGTERLLRFLKVHQEYRIIVFHGSSCLTTTVAIADHRSFRHQEIVILIGHAASNHPPKQITGHFFII